MEVSRNVVMDLLPVYLAGEASQDTRALVEEYIQSDKELAQMVEEAKKQPFPENIKIPINKDTEMESLRKSQAMIRRTILVGGAVLLIVLVTPLLVTAVAVYLLFLR
jgi:predicted S18 family serine protease